MVVFLDQVIFRFSNNFYLCFLDFRQFLSETFSIALTLVNREWREIGQNQNNMVKWTSKYCPISKLLETVEDFAFHKHNYHSVQSRRPTAKVGVSLES